MNRENLATILCVDDEPRIVDGLAVQLRREYQENKDNGEQKDATEFASFDPELARAAGVIDHIAGGQNLVRFILKKLEGGIDRSLRNAADGNGVELYWDRPPESWPKDDNGDLTMFTHQLDLHGLLALAK